MAIVTLEEQKLHLGVTLDADDNLISGQIDAAQAFIENFLGYVIEDEFETVPDDLVSAVKMLAAHWFENREASLVGVSGQDLPTGVDDILTNRREWSF